MHSSHWVQLESKKSRKDEQWIIIILCQQTNGKCEILSTSLYKWSKRHACHTEQVDVRELEPCFQPSHRPCKSIVLDRSTSPAAWPVSGWSDYPPQPAPSTSSQESQAIHDRTAEASRFSLQGATRRHQIAPWDARKPTWVSLIYHTEPTTKKGKNRKTKSRKQICSEITVNSPGNHVVNI